MEMKECLKLWRWFDGMVLFELKGWCFLGLMKSFIDMEVDEENMMKYSFKYLIFDIGNYIDE